MVKRISLFLIIVSSFWTVPFAFDMFLYANSVQNEIKEYQKIDYTQFHSGDIIFHTSKSSQSLAIQLATKSKFSHVGIIYKKGNEYFVFEAIQPVQTTPLNKWISRGEDGHFTVMRLDKFWNGIDSVSLKKLYLSGERYNKKNYDLYFEWSDERIYCSELVWKVYKDALNIEIGKLQKLSEFDLTNETVKKKLVERYGNKIPLDEPVISPQSIFESDQLRLVISR